MADRRHRVGDAVAARRRRRSCPARARRRLGAVQRRAATSRSRARRRATPRATSAPSRRCRRRSPARSLRRARPSRSRATAPWATCAPTSMHVAACVERVEVLGERSPTPTSMPSVSAVPGMSSTPSISSISQSCRSGAAGREADAAVAHDHGRDAVPGRRGEVRVPGRLPVVVGVDVDEARGDEQAVGVDLAAAGARRGTPPR